MTRAVRARSLCRPPRRKEKSRLQRDKTTPCRTVAAAISKKYLPPRYPRQTLAQDRAVQTAPECPATFAAAKWFPRDLLRHTRHRVAWFSLQIDLLFRSHRC